MFFLINIKHEHFWAKCRKVYLDASHIQYNNSGDFSEHSLLGFNEMYTGNIPSLLFGNLIFRLILGPEDRGHIFLQNVRFLPNRSAEI
jgi:hypothetical protein